MIAFDGQCHCGNIHYRFEASAPLEALGLRACQCGFCRAHGARNTSDPNGLFRMRVDDEAALQRYRFGLKTADFLLCRHCGAYVAAMLVEEGRAFVTVNANTFCSPPAADFPLRPMDFDAEDEAGRVARRIARWTPVAPEGLEP